MIPIRLEMKNFLPYRAPDPLRFDGIHLACLTGANGAGKSSLLDAITWALWGKARTRRDDDLIHMGQADMYVQLEFMQENVRYRVIRRRTAGKRGQGSLDLYVHDADKNEDNLITEPSIRMTQAKINEILRLDYDTFVHSAFLQQGKADAFTTQPPAERKRILSDILGLERWSKYEDAAKEKLKEISNNLTFFDNRLQEIEQELARRPGLLRDQGEAEARHQEAIAALQAEEERLGALAHIPTERNHTLRERETVDARLRELERDITDAETNIAQLQKQIDNYQEIIAAQAEIEAGYAALKAARESDRALSDTLRQLQTLDQERSDLQNQLTAARTRLLSERESVVQRITELEKDLSRDISADLEEVRAEVTALQAQEAEHQQLDAQLKTMSTDKASREGHLQAITGEGQALRIRLERLQEAAPDAAACPLCGQPLDGDHLQELLKGVEVEVQQKRDEFQTVRDEIDALDSQIKTDTKTFTKLGRELKKLSAVMQRFGNLEEQANARDEAQAQLSVKQDELNTLDAQLDAEDYARETRARLDELNAQRDALGYDNSAHESVQSTLETHVQYETMHTRLSVALESLPNVQSSHERETKRLHNLQTVKAEKEESQITLAETLARLDVLLEEFHQREQAVNTQRTLERNAHERVISVAQELKTLDQQEERGTTLTQRRDDARRQEALYNDLRQAFGKNGVPAMVIETAIPELEQAANALLSKMTNGRMHMRLNTQREKVSGGQMETLEIAIADELGDRNYELYSGGEAFRINFALRVALSQMLARRAGAHLRTLFIDEGFGTQDDNGRAKLVEAINAVQEEFDMVLVITHIDELRDSFPVHIAVDKTENGSRIRVV